jgi:hypothetical protein
VLAVWFRELLQEEKNFFFIILCNLGTIMLYFLFFTGFKSSTALFMIIFTFTITYVIAVGFGALHERDVSAVEIRIFFKRANCLFYAFYIFQPLRLWILTFLPVLLKE